MLVYIGTISREGLGKWKTYDTVPLTLIRQFCIQYTSQNPNCQDPEFTKRGKRKEQGVPRFVMILTGNLAARSLDEDLTMEYNRASVNS